MSKKSISHFMDAFELDTVTRVYKENSSTLAELTHERSPFISLLTANGLYFIGELADDAKRQQTWLYAQVSTETIFKIFYDEITLRDAFLSSTENLILVKLPFEVKPISISDVKIEEVAEELMPTNESFIGQQLYGALIATFLKNVFDLKYVLDAKKVVNKMNNLSEATHIENLMKELKKSPIVTVGGKGGAAEYMKEKINKLKDSK